VDVAAELEVCSKFDKFNNKSQYVFKAVLIVSILEAMLKRSNASFQKESDLVSFLSGVGDEGLFIIFEYLIEGRVYLDDALVLQ